MKDCRKICFFFVSLLLVLPMAITVVFAENNVFTPKKIVVGETNRAQTSNTLNNKAQKKAKSQRRSTRSTHSEVVSVSVENEQQKSLDLSLSISDLEKNALSDQLNQTNEISPASLFATKKKRPRLLSLDGQVLMSQEPEADKKKSMDGAGITINLKR